MESIPVNQTQPAQWANFTTQRKMQGLFLLPYIYETKDFSGTENPYLKDIIGALQELYHSMAAHFDLEVCWIESGNHLTKEYLEGIQFSITSVAKERVGELFMNREVDLVIANGWPVLDLVHNDKIPTLLHSGFLPSPLHFSKSIAHQRILFTAPGKADFIMTHDPEEYEFLNKYNDILGLGESERLLIKTRKNSPFSTQLTKSKTLQSFLTEPCIKPKRQSLMARIDEHYQNRIETLRRDLNEQRDSELLWMRKAFTQEIEKLLGELEELRNHLHHQEKQSDQPQHENLKLALEASEDRERKANDHIQQLEKELSKSSSVEPHVNSAEVEELRKTVGDLHSKLQRYKSQVPFVVAQWSYDFLLTYLVRLPLTILLLVYHIGTSLLHRYKMSRGSN